MHETAFLSFLFFFLSFWTRKINFVIKLFVEWVKNKKSMLLFSFAWSFVDSFLRFKVDIRRVSDKLRFDGLAFLAVDGVHSEPSHRLCHRDESGESRKGPRKAWHDLFCLESFPPAVMSQGDGKAPQGMTQPLLFGIVPPAVMSQGDGKAPQGMTQPLLFGIVPPSCDESRWRKGPTGHDTTSSIWNRLPSCDESRWRKGPAGHDTTSSTWNHPPSCDESGGVKERPQKGLTWPLLFGIVPPAVMSRGEGKAPERPDMTSSIWNRPTSCDESGWRKGPRKAWHDLFYLESSHELWWVRVTERPQKGLTWPLLFGIIPRAVMSQGDGKAPAGHDTTSSAWNRPPSCDESRWQKGPRWAWRDLFRLELSHQLWWVRGNEWKAPERPDTTSFIWNFPPPPPQAMMSQGEWRKAPERPHMTSAMWNRPTSCDESGWQKGPNRAWHDMTSSAWNRPTSCDESGWQKGPNRAWHDMTSSAWNRPTSCDESVKEGPPERPDTTSSIWNCPSSCDELGWRNGPSRAWHDLFRLESSPQLCPCDE